MYIVLAILAFGIIIAVHELGHFLAAKAMNVKVLEFAIGMGPKILSKQGKETLYSLRIVPFGGFCSMEGEYGERPEKENYNKNKDSKPRTHLAYEGVAYEHAEGNGEPEHIINDFVLKSGSDGDQTAGPDPRSFIAQKRWKRIVILIAGSVFNLAAAFIITFILSLGAEGYISTTLHHVDDRLPEEGPGEILAGDTLYAINGERIYYYNDYGMFMNLNADKPVTITILRDGEFVEYQRRAYTVDGQQVYRYSLSFAVIEPTLWEVLKYSVYQTYNFVRMIRVSISMMISGAASVTEVAGPVGIISVMNTVGRESPDVGAAIANIVYFTAFIGVNVGIINMLPIPAMDGGRVLFIFITWVIEKTTRRELDPKYENYINTGAFMLLIGLMVIIMFNDVMRILNG